MSAPRKQGPLPRLLVIASFVGLILAVCALTARATGADPMAAFEVGVAGAIAAWMTLLARSLWRGRRLATALRPKTLAAQIEGIDCRVVFGPERRAFVLGAIHPTIYVGEALLIGLEADELHAILLHEDFHRRTFAPLRAASLEAWIRLARPVARVEEALADRLVDLERAADRYALRHGATIAGIASALIKVDAAEAGSGVAFASAADRRVGGLLAYTAGDEQAEDGLPYEWLPPAAALVILALCHLVGA